jgi:heme exporter protein C
MTTERETMSAPSNRLPTTVVAVLLAVVGIVAIAAYAVSPTLVFYHARLERELGLSQKIFYFHVGCAWSMFIAVGVAAIGSLQFLRTRERAWDDVALSGAQLVVVFGIAVLTSGPIWGKLAWGTFWVWDARLTSTLLLFLTFVAYGLLRRFGGPGADRLSAGLGLFGAGVSPFVFTAVNLWRTQHPKNSVAVTLPPDMALAFWISVLAFVCLLVLVCAARIGTAHAESELDDLVLRATDLGLYDDGASV